MKIFEKIPRYDLATPDTEIYTQVLSQTAQSLREQNPPLPDSCNADDIAYEILEGVGSRIIAIVGADKKLLGHTRIRTNHSEDGEQIIEGQGLYVLPEHRGQGLGQLLMGEAGRAAEREGAQEVFFQISREQVQSGFLSGFYQRTFGDRVRNVVPIERRIAHENEEGEPVYVDLGVYAGEAQAAIDATRKITDRLPEDIAVGYGVARMLRRR